MYIWSSNPQIVYFKIASSWCTLAVLICNCFRFGLFIYNFWQIFLAVLIYCAHKLTLSLNFNSDLIFWVATFTLSTFSLRTVCLCFLNNSFIPAKSLTLQSYLNHLFTLSATHFLWIASCIPYTARKKRKYAFNNDLKWCSQKYCSHSAPSPAQSRSLRHTSAPITPGKRREMHLSVKDLSETLQNVAKSMWLM